MMYDVRCMMYDVGIVCRPKGGCYHTCPTRRFWFVGNTKAGVTPHHTSYTIHSWIILPLSFVTSPTILRCSPYPAPYFPLVSSLHDPCFSHPACYWFSLLNYHLLSITIIHYHRFSNLIFRLLVRGTRNNLCL